MSDGSILRPDDLETAMLGSWSRFLDRERLLALALRSARDRADLRETDGEPPLGVRLSLSRFHWREDGAFEVWVDLVVPTPGGVVEGTTEVVLFPDGRQEAGRTVGVIYPGVVR